MWFIKNKVLLLGLLSAIAVALQQFAGSGPVELIPCLIAVGLAVTGFLGNNLRGAWVTLVGILGVALITLGQVYYGVAINWTEVIGMAIAVVLTTNSPGPKKATYEADPTIERAKR